MFDVKEYNQFLLFGIFVIATLGLIFLLKRKITTIVDPLCLHIVWISGHIAFILTYICKYGIEPLPFFFLLNIFIYVYFLRLYPISCKRSIIIQQSIETIKHKEKRIKLLFFIIFMFWIFSKRDFFKYIFENPNITSWFFYRFIDLQGRDPLLRIIGTSSGTYLYLLSFIFLFLIKKHRVIASMVLVIILTTSILAGGRSSLLSLLASFGIFVFYFGISKISKKINVFGGIGIIVALSVAMFVSAQYDGNSSMKDGMNIIVNRTAAVGDGLEYYMKYDGYNNIKSGVYEYCMSIFGIYVKNITGVNYKNIGTQLTEMAKGEEVYFAQGANYTFLLQIMVLGFGVFLVYSPVIAYMAMKLRYNVSRRIQWLPLSYFLSSSCFTIATDMEYAVFTFISGVLFYFIIIYPVLKIRLK